MAELATAGSLVGLISLSIQSCQGLTSYYSAWKSYDEQIGHTHRNLEELRTTCETLELELQRITQYQEPAVQQVVRLIASCRDRINNLHHALEQCRSVQIPHTLAAKLELYRARALYPFRKQTLNTLKDNVHSVQSNLSSAMQVLQVYVGIYQGSCEITNTTVIAIFPLGMSKVLHSWRGLRPALRQPFKTTRLQSRHSRCHCKTLAKRYRFCKKGLIILPSLFGLYVMRLATHANWLANSGRRRFWS